MDSDCSHPLRKGFSYPVHALLWSHALLALAFMLAQPSGFAFGSQSFFEHQVLVPAYFTVAAWTAIGGIVFPRSIAAPIGLIAGAWTAGGTSVVWMGSTAPAAAVGIALLCGLGMIALILKNLRRAGDPVVRTIPGYSAGLLLGMAYITCAWAPPASTRLVAIAPENPQPRFVPTKTTPFRISVDFKDARLTISTTGERLELWPLMSFDAASDSGFWTVFDFRQIRAGPWIASRRENGVLILESKQEDLDSETRVWSEGDHVHVRTMTTLKRDIAAHLSTSFRILARGPARLEGDVRWEKGTGRDIAEFVAFREGKLEFLRAAFREKGPFESLASWEPRDPRLTVGSWKIRVTGWADQASRAASPTAGWGVSQGSIEKMGEEYVWSLASTSIGRGWHSVRTGRGAYVLEAIISRAAP